MKKQKFEHRIADLEVSKNGKMTWKDAELSWGLSICGEDGVSKEIDSSELKEFDIVVEKDMKICIWRNHEELGKNFEVKTSWRIVDDQLSGTIAWGGGDGNSVIEKALFPIVKVSMPSEGNIFIPRLLGMLLKNIENNDLRPKGIFFDEEETQSAQMQYSALIGSDTSYYFDQRDTEFHIKTYRYCAIDDFSKICYKGVHFLPLDGKSSIEYEVPYASGMAVFNGGWFEAAQIYKKWARNQKWAKRPPVDERLRNVGMWIWNRGAAEDVISPVERFAEDSGVPVALDWYWWHKNAYDTSYPDYWPPREGESVFKSAISRLNGKNIYSQVYLNGVTWDMDSEHWENGGSDSVVVNKDGTEMAAMFNVFAKKRLAWMCGGDNLPFRKKIKETVEKLKDSGLSGVYLDMIECATNIRTCHNKKHKHAPGGGNYQVVGYREMLQEIVDENPGFPLSSEEPSEAYMDLFDSSISLSGGVERLGYDPELLEPVPAFSCVYHGLNAVFGNYALPDSIPPFDPKWPENSVWKNEKDWHKIFPDQFFFEIARSVIWGLQPTVANFKMEHIEDPKFRDIYKFLIDTARFYHAHREFLFDGDMLNPGVIQTEEMDVEFLSRFIFTEEGKEKIFHKKAPAVLHSLWKASDGRLAAVLVNYSQKAQSFELESPDIKVAGEIPPRSWLLHEKL